MKFRSAKNAVFGFLPLASLLVLPLVAGTARIYVTNAAGDSVHVIDPVTNKVVQVIPDLEEAHGIMFSPDAKRLYLSIESEAVLAVLDRESGKLIKKIPLSGRPNNLCITKDGGRVLVAIAESPGVVDVIDTATLTKPRSIPIEPVRLHNVFITPDGKYAAATSIPKMSVTIIDLQTEKPVWKVQFDKAVRPLSFEVNPDGSTKRMFVQLNELNGFAVVDFEARKEVARIKVPEIKTNHGVLEDKRLIPCHGIGVAPDNKSVWSVSTKSNAVFAYSLPDLKLLGYVRLPEILLPGRDPIGAVPEWLTFTPDSKFVYVSNSGTNSVSAINVKTLKEAARIPVGEVPKRINTLVLP